MDQTDKFSLADGDFADRCATVERNTDQAARAERRARNQAIADAAEKAAGLSPTSYACIASRTRDGRVLVTTLDHPVFVGQLAAVGRDLQHALRELRFKYASELVKRKFFANMQESRAYSLRAEFVAKYGVH